MKSLWQDKEAKQYTSDLDQRVYTSRLLGREPSLVLHGGGNTSVKITETNLLDEEETRLYVKGSGWDLETIEADGFAPVRMEHLLKLAKLERLSDPQMVNELKTHTTKATAPSPSVETILHAILPYKFVDHTHADTIIAVTNTQHGHERIEDIYSDTVVIIPYVMPGFDLARLCAQRFEAEANANTIGMVLMNHGIFSFGTTAKESYERMIHLVTKAEDYIKTQGAWTLPDVATTTSHVKTPSLRQSIAALRHDLSAAADTPLVLRTYRDQRSLNFVTHNDVATLSQQGPATPDHVIRSKQLPMIGRDIGGYTKAYRDYFKLHAANVSDVKTILDPAPRVILDKELGLCCAGRSAKDTKIVGDIYQHTIEVILRATALGGYQALPAKDIFDMEYWDLEQAKLKKSGKPPLFQGEVVLITGAASGIGQACVTDFLNHGAAVIGIDINQSVIQHYDRTDYLGLQCDVTNEEHIKNCLEQGIQHFGGLDMLILNAGIFPGGCRIDALTSNDWHKVFTVNLDANLTLMRETHPLLKLAPNGGRVVIIGSKNVPAPGPGAAAYSASKAALNQLARVAALEWGNDNIRINTVHPNAVFDTALWTDEVLQARADHYGINIEEYKRRNVLGVEVTSQDVAALVAEMCGPLFAKTTGAQIPIDGGNERVI